MSHARPVAFRAKALGFGLGVIKEQSPRWVRRAVQERGVGVARLALNGNEVECPACGTTALRFIRGRCAGCAASPRQRLLAVFLRRELGLDDTTRARILHFAPEPGLVRMLSSLPGVDYVPGDLVPDTGHTLVDATAIHLEPTFDGIIMSHVLEHIPDDATAMSEMFRVLRPGGWAVVVGPVASELEHTYQDDAIRSRWARHRHYGQHDHVRLYGRDFPDLLRGAGFVVRPRRYAAELPPGEAQRFGLRPGVIHDCRKPGPADG